MTERTSDLPITLGHCLAILRVRWRSGVLAMFLVLGIAFVGVRLLPAQFEATASILVDARAPDPVSGQILPQPVTSTLMSTQIAIATSERVARLAVGSLRLTRDETLVAKWEALGEGRAPLERWLAAEILRNLTVEQGKDSNVLTIAVRDREATRAAATANAVANAYLKVSAELRSDPAERMSRSFSEQSTRLRTDLDQARSRLADYERQHGIVATEGSLDLESRLLTEMSTQLLELQVQADASRSQSEASSQNADQSGAVLESRVIDALKVELSSAESTLRDLRSSLGARHPDLIKQRNLVADLQTRLNTEVARISGSNQVKDRVDSRRLSALKKQVEAQREKVLVMRTQRDRADGLLNDVENAQRAYDAVVERTGKATLDTKTPQSLVSLLESAAEPLKPASARAIKLLVAAAGLALLLAFAVPLWREWRDERLRSEEDVLARLGLRTLGVMGDSSRLSAYALDSARHLVGSQGSPAIESRPTHGIA